MPHKGIRIIIALTGSAMLACLTSMVVGAYYLEYVPNDQMEPAIAWSPGNAELWRRSARSKVLSLNDEELTAAATQYREALKRNPFAALAWQGLASIETRLGDPKTEEAILRGWIASVPHSPQAAWALANLLLRQGRTDEALPHFQQAAADEESLRFPLFDLAWKLLDDPRRILRDVVPSDARSQYDYFRYLVDRRGNLQDAYSVWRNLQGQLPIAGKFDGTTAALGLTYAEKLAAAGMGEDAARVMDEAVPPAPASPGSGNVTSGDFELPLQNGGLDWRMVNSAGYQLALDDFAAASGSRSLRVEFDGTTNPEFAAVQQWVVVEPNRDYRLTASLKTESISTDSGIYLSLTNVADLPARVQEAGTKPLVGSSPWTEYSLDFHSGATTQVMLLQLRRRASSKLNNLLRGTIWLDAVSIHPR